VIASTAFSIVTAPAITIAVLFSLMEVAVDDTCRLYAPDRGHKRSNMFCLDRRRTGSRETSLLTTVTLLGGRDPREMVQTRSR